jgi:hypothetical protein
MEVFEEFVSSKITKYSMSTEYGKGSFAPYIKAMLENLGEVIEIQNKYRENPLVDALHANLPELRQGDNPTTQRV